MKTAMTILTITVILMYSVLAQIPTVIPPEWKITVKVVDDVGQPIDNAQAVVESIKPSTASEAIRQSGNTDTNGLLTVSGRSFVRLYFNASKNGYYKAGKTYDLSTSVESRYQPWNPEITLVLNKIGKPIPMYARKAQIEIPETNKVVGFDLVEGDWVTPYGKGKQNDFIFQVERRWASRKDFDCTVKLNFSNRGDGLFPVSITLNQGNGLRMPAIAPLEGYLPEISKSLSHTPTHGWNNNERDGNREQNYYFRIRTILDEQGNVKSALYGKIYDDFALDPINSKTTWVLFTYYLDPTPNDQNTEFDSSQNLAKNLKSGEGVSAP